MTGFKNIFLIKWVFRIILIIGLTPDFLATEISNYSSSRYPHTTINFYSIPAATKREGKNSELHNPLSWNASLNHTVEYWDFDISIPEDPNHCQNEQIVPCDPSDPYRTMNGSCNNLIHPTWGTANECYMRFQPAFFEEAGEFRKSISGNPLPDIRDLTLNIFKDVHRPSPNVSFMFTIYGQTVAHDFSQAKILAITLDCCSSEFANHSACAAVPVKSDDPFYSRFNKTCLPLHRSQPCSHCNTKNREQINVVTAPLDASMLYGTNDSRVMDLRTMDGTGKLILISTEHGEILPTDNDAFALFCPQRDELTCFFSGDIRVNQHALLTGITTYFAREHNRLATKLKMINPHWEEEKLFQEARRINIATLQCITYKEYLPQLLGPYIMEQFNFTVEQGSGGSKYNPSIRLGVWIEFATAAFRLHSMIAKTIGAMGLSFKDIFQNQKIIREGHLERIMEGVCKVQSEEYDFYYINDVTNYMGKQPGVPHGHDLSSIDIQRGRDHGLAPYTVMVRFCSEGRVAISTFDDLAPLLMTKMSAEMLKETYEAVEDIELFVGMQMEHRFPGSAVGPTAACIIAKQFYFAKFGDRFFFEHEGEVPSFTADQRNSLKQCSLSRLLCDNSNIREVQKNVMLLPSNTNPVVPCKDIPEIDLLHWTDIPPTAK